MPNRTLAIGDIHGCAAALRALLTTIKPDATDTIITLGDYVDRGRDCAEVLDILTEMISVCRLVPLLGNHEIMMTQAMTSRREFEFWIFNGGKSTLDSYGGDLNNIPMHHRTFLNHCRKFYETESHIFVHAAYDHELTMNDQPDDLLFWQHVGDEFIPLPHESGKKVICGHTPQIDGEVCDFGHIQLLDTYCYGGKWLTAMNVDTGEVLQADLSGNLREPVTDLSQQHNDTDHCPPVDPAIETAWPFTETRKSPLEHDSESFKKTIDQVVSRITDHFEHIDDSSVNNSLQSDQWFTKIDEPIPRHTTDIETLLEQLFEEYIPHSFNTASAGYLAYIPGGGILDAAIADLIAATTNRYVTVWNASPALAQIESTVIRWFCQMMGYDDQAGGFLATGGSMANLSALVVARVKLIGDDFSKARIYASDQTHHCIDKAAFMAGFPRANLRSVGVDDRFQIDIDDLKRKISEDRAAGFQPLMVVGNAGTTNTGAIDDLKALREVADAEGCWLHIDAAYGGFFALTKRGHQALRGIELADSIVLDPHKAMFVPYGTGCLLVKRRGDLLPAFQFTSEYMPQMTGDRLREDICEISPELSRSNRGLRIWLPIKLHGIGVWEQLLDEKLDLTHWAYEQLLELQASLVAEYQSCELEILGPPSLSIVAFRINLLDEDLEKNNEVNQDWLDAINAEGSVMMTGTILDGKFILRICIVSFRTHIDRMQKCLSVIRETALRLVANSSELGRNV